MNPIILYQNIFASGVTATSTESGYSVDNLYDMRSYTKWKATGSGTQNIDMTVSATSCNCIGIFNHNLGTIGATIKVQYNNSGYQTLKTIEPTDDSPILATFDATSDTEWRIELSSMSAAPEIAIIYLGTYLAFSYPPDAPAAPVEETIRASTEYSEAGHLLGTVIAHYQQRISHRFTNHTKTWWDASWIPFYNNHAKLIYPFFYAWNLTARPTEIYFGALEPDYVRNNTYTTLDYVDSFELRMRGVST